MLEGQALLPTFEAPVLKPGPVFFLMELGPLPVVDKDPETKAKRVRELLPFKARHRSRVAFAGGKPFVHNYPDPITEQFETQIGQYARLVMRAKPPTENPVALLVHALVPIPASWSKREKTQAAMGGLAPTGRPDADNYLKIADALNGIVWRDDAQVVDARIIKRYSEEPALRIEVREFLIDGLVKL